MVHIVNGCGLELKIKTSLDPNEWEECLYDMCIEGHYSELLPHLLCHQLHTLLSSYWEKQPVIFRNGMNAEGRLDVIFSKSALSELCECMAVPYMNNMNVVKYTDGKRVTTEYPPTELATRNAIRKLFKSGNTIQFFLPQRFSDGLHNICAGFEHTFGTLASSSAYLTPALSQGLAPHWDDVEVFVIQTEGTKKWHLWEGFSRLPDSCSHDISREELTDPPVEVILNPGDVLYLPRGTIHEAIAMDSFSTHVTVSAYQKYNTKGLVEKLLPAVLQRLFEASSNATSGSTTNGVPAIRAGLPLQMSQLLGSHASAVLADASSRGVQQTLHMPTIPFCHADDAKTSNGVKVDVKRWRNRFLSEVKEVVSSLADYVTMEDVDDAADMYGDDFCISRLPLPEPEAEDSDEISPASADSVTVCDASELQHIQSEDDLLDFLQALDSKKNKECVIRICDPKWTHIRLEECDGEVMVLIGSGMQNDRLRHMGHPPLPDPDSIPPKSKDEMSSSGSDSDEAPLLVAYDSEPESPDTPPESESEPSEDELSQSDDDSDDDGNMDDWVRVSLPEHMHTLLIRLQRPYQTEEDVSKKNRGFLSFKKFMHEGSEVFEEEEILGCLLALLTEGLLEVGVRRCAKDKTTTSRDKDTKVSKVKSKKGNVRDDVKRSAAESGKKKRTFTSQDDSNIPLHRSKKSKH